MSGRRIKQFACLFLCFFFASSAAALAGSMPVSAGGVQTEPVSEAETPAIEEDFWLSGDYMLSVLEDMDGERRVEIYMEDPETGRQVLWVFPCSAGSKPDHLLSHTCTETENTYNEDNLLVQDIYPDMPCEAHFILDEKDRVTVSGAPDARLDGRVFSRLDDSGVENGEFFRLEEGQEWWVEYKPYESLALFRPVRLEGRNWFWVHQMPGNVYSIFEPYQDQSVISYLIPGEESALLWDTGMGIANIRECVEQLTDLPVTVLNSHDHFDHTGGNYLFENVMCYNIPSAVRTLTEGQTHADLLEYVDPALIVNVPADFDKEHFRRIGKAPTATVEDGQVIDLGGRKLEVLYTPGHSASSIMLIDEANGILFTGDTWYPGPLYAYMEDSSLPDYVSSMRRAGEVIRERNIRWIYPSHNDVLPGTDLFFETIDFLQDVLDGKVNYQIDEGMRCYTMDSIISLYMKLEENGDGYGSLSPTGEP